MSGRAVATFYEMKLPSPGLVLSNSASAADVTVSAGVSHVIRALGISLPGTAVSGFTIGSSFIRSLPKTVEQIGRAHV